jgi:hypothetical protein
MKFDVYMLPNLYIMTICMSPFFYCFQVFFVLCSHIYSFVSNLLTKYMTWLAPMLLAFFITIDVTILNYWKIAIQTSPWELLSNEKNCQINCHSQKKLAN